MGDLADLLDLGAGFGLLVGMGQLAQEDKWRSEWFFWASIDRRCLNRALLVSYYGGFIEVIWEVWEELINSCYFLGNLLQQGSERHALRSAAHIFGPDAEKTPCHDRDDGGTPLEEGFEKFGNDIYHTWD